MYPSFVAMIDSRSVMAARNGCRQQLHVAAAEHGARDLMVQEDHPGFGQVARIFEIDGIRHWADEVRKAAVAGRKQTDSFPLPQQPP